MTSSEQWVAVREGDHDDTYSYADATAQGGPFSSYEEAAAWIGYDDRLRAVKRSVTVDMVARVAQARERANELDDHECDDLANRGIYDLETAMGSIPDSDDDPAAYLRFVEWIEAAVEAAATQYRETEVASRSLFDTWRAPREHARAAVQESQASFEARREHGRVERESRELNEAAFRRLPVLDEAPF